MMEINKIHQGDCLELMKQIKDKSVDMILCDLPYGTTACKWDSIIHFDKLWKQYERIIKDNGAIVLTASQPFTSSLIMSNPRLFKYCWVWNKKQSSSPLNCKYQPHKVHEDIVIFSFSASTYSKKSQMKYFPIMSYGNKHYVSGKAVGDEKYHGYKCKGGTKNIGSRYPKSIISFSKESGLHPTQKPLELGRYLVKTYTNEGDLVLDNTCGSGTFPLSAKLENRNFIGIELDEKYCEIARKRVKEVQTILTQELGR